jgi:hypothetical protein
MSAQRNARARALVGRLFAEFGVIVLGVLVALGVDSWSEEREAAVRELELLRSLATDLRGSLAGLRDDQDFTRGREATLEWLLRYPTEGGAVVPVDSLPSITRAANWTAAYYPTLRTYETMIGTGTFDLISNAGIRLALADVKSQTEVYQDYRSQATRQWNDVYSVIWLERTGVHPLPSGGSLEPVPGAYSAETVTTAMRDEFFRAVIDRRRIFLFYVADNGDNLVTAMSDALELIEEELAERSS